MFIVYTTYVLKVYVCGVYPSRDDDKGAIFIIVVTIWLLTLRDYHQNLATACHSV